MLFKTLNKNYYKLFFLLMISISLLSLAFAYFVEYILGHEPCILCLYQRIPYFIIAVVSTIAIGAKKFYKYALLLIAVSIASNIALAGYHFGVEQGVFEATDKCAGRVDFAKAHSLEELKTLIYSAPLARCDQVNFLIFGTSMTAWNFLFNILLLGILLLVRREEK